MRGAGLKGVALIADNSWELGHPMFQRLLRRSGLPEDAFFLGTSSEYGLTEALQSKQVKVVMPLGERALRATIGASDIARWRGRVVEHPHLPNVWVVPGLQPSRLMSRHGDGEEQDALSRHPPRFHGVWIRDLHTAVRVASEGFSRLPVHYLVDPTPGVFAGFADEYFAALANDPLGVWLSWDIETPYKQDETDESELEEKENELDALILRISFCFRPGYAVSVPWTPDYLPTIVRLLRSTGVDVVWNGRTFDVPVVETAGYEVLGEVWDGMDAYHLLQSDLPKGLEWVSSESSDLLPWKHLSQAQPGWYSATDADAALRNMIWLRKQLVATGQWRLYVNHVVRLMPLLDYAGRHGNKVDRAKREEIRSKLTAMRDELVAEIQQYVPRELFPRTLYKCHPDEVAGDFPKSFEPVEPVALDRWDVVYEPSDEKVCSACGQFASNKTDHFKGSVGPVNPKSGKPTRLKNPCKEAGGEIVKKPAFVPRFLRLEPFNPNSSDQLKAYMRHFGHPLGVDKKDASKETADANHLKKLHKTVGAKFPLYSKSLVVHKVSKTIGTYTPEPDEQDLIHTQYVNSTATWRLGSRKVKNGTQMQNWSKRKDDVPANNAEEKAALKLAMEARKQIIARPGHKLVQIDSSAVEAVMQGHYMNDPDYMNLASKSIHAWLSCKALGIAFTPENVDIVKEKHAGLYSKMKVVNYLTNFGGGPKLMHDTYPEDFPTKKDAEDTQDLLYALLPTLKTYHHAVRHEAHTKTFLQSPWGYRHWYYDVFKRKPDGSITLSKDSKRCVAFKPQNSNAAFQRDNLLLFGVSPIDGAPITTMAELDARWPELQALWKAGKTWGAYYTANVSIHDSLCIDCPIELVEKAADDMLAVFTRPIPEMNGLRIGAEVEAGDNWGSYDEKDNPGGMQRIKKLVAGNYTFEHTAAGLPLAA